MEIELKLQVTDPDCWSRILSIPALRRMASGRVKRVAMEAHYFDTAKRALQKARIAYRIRREGKRWIATIKTQGSSLGGLHQRPEWSAKVKDAIPDMDVFAKLPVFDEIKKTLGPDSLRAHYITRFQRDILNLSLADGSLVELAADRGGIVAGDRNAPILEIELELKSGHPASLLSLGALLAEHFPLRLEARSKLHRAIELAGHTESEPSSYPALNCEWDGALPVVQNAERQLLALVHQLLHRADGFCATPDDKAHIEAMHLLLLRLQGLLVFFDPLFDREASARHLEALALWQAQIDKIQCLDAIYRDWRRIRKKLPYFDQDQLFDEYLMDMHRDAVRALERGLETGRFTPAILHLWADIARLPTAHDAAPQSMESFMENRLEALENSVLKGGQKRLGELHDLHNKVEQLAACLDCLISQNSAPSVLPKAYSSLRRMLAQHTRHQCLFQTLMETVDKIESKSIHRDAGILLGWTGRKLAKKKNRPQRIWKKARQHRGEMAMRWRTQNIAGTAATPPPTPQAGESHDKS